MSGLQTLIGAPTENFKLDGRNYIDLFSVAEEDPIGGTAPATGMITIRGVTYPTNLWAINDKRTYKFENHHGCNQGAGVLFQPHIRLFPTTDAGGTVSFTYDYFFKHVDGSTSTGGTCTLSGEILGGDKTADKGIYISCVLDSTNMQGGTQIIGVLTRVAGTYAPVVSLSEYGIHAPVIKTGFPLVIGD
jgi:hypothetical protein